MKRRFTILTAALALLACLAVPMGMRGQTEVVAYTLDGTITGGDNGYATESTITQNSVEWKVTGNTTMSPWRLGGKSLSSVDRPIYSTSAFSDDVTKVVVTTGTTNATVNAVKLVVSSSSDFSSATTLTEDWVASGEITFNRPAGADWSNMYFKIIYNITVSGNSNKYAEFKKAEFYKEVSGPAPTTYTVTYDANGGMGTMTDSNSPYTSGATVTVLANSFTRDNYTFSKWNTAADGSGTDYVAGNTFTINANTTLYAQWTENGGGTGGDGTLTFDFEDDGAHRASGSNSYGNNSYEENGVDIDMTYFDAIQNGAIGGSYLARGRVAKNTTNSPVMIIGPIDIADKNITGISFKTEGPNTITEAFATSTDGTNYTNHLTFTLTNTSTIEQKSVNNLEITGSELYLKWTGTVSSSTGSNRDFDVDDIVVTYTDASNPAVATTTTINVPSGFNNDLHNGTNAGTLSATVTANGTAISGATVTWTSSNTSVATVGETTGVVTLVAVGTTTITASYAGVEDEYRPSSDTYELTVIDSYAAGTVNNPYTVAQAIANTPSNGNVYIQGIVSSFYNTSIVGDGSNYRYYISDDGTTTTQLLVYKGKGLNQATFTNANDLLVGDEVVIYGSLITYQNAPEVASGNYLYSWNRPTADVEAPTFSPVAGTYTEAQSVTISCATTGANIYYTTDGTEPSSASTPYTSAIAVSNTTTIKAIAYVGNAASTVATATYHFCSAEDPYTVTEALAFNEYPANGIYVSGIVSTAPTSLSNGTLTYYISVDGNATNQLEVYKGKDMGNENFTSVDDIQVGDIVTIYGNVVIYNNTKEFAQGNYLVSFERPAQQYTLTVTCSTNVEIFTFVDPNEQGVEGPTTQQVTSGTEVGISVSATTGYILTLMVDGTDVTSQLDETGYYTFYMPTHDVTVTATASAPPVVTTNTYTLATSIESGKQYIIVGQANGDYYAMGNDKGNNRYAYGITLNGTTASATVASGNYVHEFTISSLASDGFYSICDAIEPGYLYAASSGSNYLKTEATLDENHNGDWEISINSETGIASVVASNSSYTRNVMQFNNGSILFACYGSASQHPVYLYVKDETPTPVNYTLEVPGYPEGSNGGYRLIASPVTVDPSAVDGMILTGDNAVNYDLFYFKQDNLEGSMYKEWMNYKASNFNLVPGKGYLYAQKATTPGEIFQFTLSGTAYDGEPIILSKKNGCNFPGWNLVGNPYGEEAYLGNRAYYRMENGVDIVAATSGTAINAMEGVFVIANNDGEELSFSKTPGKSSAVVMNLERNRGNLIDRAIVSFGEGQQLPKFQLNRNSTKLYIPQDGQDYAVVCAEEMGEMPVNFEAESNGTYCLSFSSENTELAYLHLIDNFTGKNIDLLQTPSYSFEAKSTDYASRFKLVFATGDNSNSDSFAFFSNGSFVINNEGNATLQVIDVTGRIIKSQSINGSANVNMNAAPGVYMLRLVNGDNVKVQKVVVK